VPLAGKFRDAIAALSRQPGDDELLDHRLRKQYMALEKLPERRIAIDGGGAQDGSHIYSGGRIGLDIPMKGGGIGLGVGGGGRGIKVRPESLDLLFRKEF
jgi:hypothetical protein